MTLFSFYMRLLAVLAITATTGGLYLLWGQGVAQFWLGPLIALVILFESLKHAEDKDGREG